MLFSIRTGRFNTLAELNDFDVPAFKLDRDQNYTETDFDREWEWLGTYNSFRAGMFVFMYPENYLLPGTWATGRPGQTSTPAFQDLIKKIA